MGTGVGVLPASEDKTLVTPVSTASEVGTQVVCSICCGISIRLLAVQVVGSLLSLPVLA